MVRTISGRATLRIVLSRLTSSSLMQRTARTGHRRPRRPVCALAKDRYLARSAEMGARSRLPGGHSSISHRGGSHGPDLGPLGLPVAPISLAQSKTSRLCEPIGLVASFTSIAWWRDADEILGTHTFTPGIGRASTYMGMERPAMSHRYNGGANMRSSGVRAAALAALISMARPPRPSTAEAETCSVVRTIALGGRFHPPFERPGSQRALDEPGVEDVHTHVQGPDFECHTLGERRDRALRRHVRGFVGDRRMHAVTGAIEDAPRAGARSFPAGRSASR